MSQLKQSLRQAVRSGNSLPARVLDATPTHVTVQLSGNGAVHHRLSVVGGPVYPGDWVQVDFTTHPPTAVAACPDLTLENPQVVAFLRCYVIPPGGELPPNGGDELPPDTPPTPPPPPPPVEEGGDLDPVEPPDELPPVDTPPTPPAPPVYPPILAPTPAAGDGNQTSNGLVELGTRQLTDPVATPLGSGTIDRAGNMQGWGMGPIYSPPYLYFNTGSGGVGRYNLETGALESGSVPTGSLRLMAAYDEILVHKVAKTPGTPSGVVAQGFYGGGGWAIEAPDSPHYDWNWYESQVQVVFFRGRPTAVIDVPHYDYSNGTVVDYIFYHLIDLYSGQTVASLSTGKLKTPSGGTINYLYSLDSAVYAGPDQKLIYLYSTTAQETDRSGCGFAVILDLAGGGLTLASIDVPAPAYEAMLYSAGPDYTTRRLHFWMTYEAVPELSFMGIALTSISWIDGSLGTLTSIESVEDEYFSAHNALADLISGKTHAYSVWHTGQVVPLSGTGGGQDGGEIPGHGENRPYAAYNRICGVVDDTDGRFWVLTQDLSEAHGYDLTGASRPVRVLPTGMSAPNAANHQLRAQLYLFEDVLVVNAELDANQWSLAVIHNRIG